MPQLDIIAFETQMFWLFAFLTGAFAALVCFVLPSLMLTFRIRTRILSDIELLRQKEELAMGKASTMVKDDLEKETVPVYDSVLKSPLLTTIAIKGKEATKAFFAFFEREEVSSFFRSNKIYIPLINLVTPNDDFILVFSFLIFFLVVYFSYSQSFIGDQLDTQINDIKQRYLKLNKLRLANLRGKLAIFESMSSLAADKQALAKLVLISLENKAQAMEKSFMDLPDDVAEQINSTLKNPPISRRDIFKTYFLAPLSHKAHITFPKVNLFILNLKRTSKKKALLNRVRKSRSIKRCPFKLFPKKILGISRHNLFRRQIIKKVRKTSKATGKEKRHLVNRKSVVFERALNNFIKLSRKDGIDVGFLGMNVIECIEYSLETDFVLKTSFYD